MRPAQVGLGKDGLVLLAAQPGGPLRILLALVKSLEENKEGELLDGVKGIRQTPGPELVPEGIDFRTEGGVGEHGANLHLGRTNANRQGRFCRRRNRRQ